MENRLLPLYHEETEEEHKKTKPVKRIFNMEKKEKVKSRIKKAFDSEEDELIFGIFSVHP